MKINILVLNYNGKEFLKECLPSVVEAVECSAYDCRVTVIDNRSDDGSIEYLKFAFEDVDVYEAEENKLLCSYNEFLERIDDDLVLMLNNDIKVDRGFIDPLVEEFLSKPNAFLVGPKCLNFNGTEYEGTRAKPYFRLGNFTAISRYPGHKEDIDKKGLTMQSPFGIFDRKKVLELNGFDEIFLPGIMEEADLCYRAYKKGWKCYYEPKSLMYHMGQATFKKYYSDKKVLTLAHRNSFIFMWKNITDPWILAKHFLLLPLRLLYFTAKGQTELLAGFRQALSMRQQVCARKKAAEKDFIKKDNEIFNEVTDNLIS